MKLSTFTTYSDALGAALAETSAATTSTAKINFTCGGTLEANLLPAARDLPPASIGSAPLLTRRPADGT